MSSISIKNIAIKGMAGCVPERVQENKDYPGMTLDEIQKYIDAILANLSGIGVALRA